MHFAWVAFGTSTESRPSDSFIWPTAAGTTVARPEANDAAATVLQALAEISRGEPSDDIFHEYRRFYNRLAAEAVEQKWDDQSPVRIERPAAPIDVPAEPAKRVLVAGTARFELTAAALDATGRVGIVLARAGYGLVTRGRRGVDHVTARGFVETLGPERSAKKYLTHVWGNQRKSGFADGREIRVPAVADKLGRSVAIADAVIIIGGRGWTEALALAAWQADKPVLPLAATGNTTADFHGRMRSDPLPLALTDLERLDADVPDAVNALTEILNRLLSGTTAPVKAARAQSLSTPFANVGQRTARMSSCLMIQHPKGSALKLALGSLLPATVPGRITYAVNSLEGSSGAPVFNSDLDVVALIAMATRSETAVFRSR